MVSYLVLNCWM